MRSFSWTACALTGCLAFEVLAIAPVLATLQHDHEVTIQAVFAGGPPSIPATIATTCSVDAGALHVVGTSSPHTFPSLPDVVQDLVSFQAFFSPAPPTSIRCSITVTDPISHKDLIAGHYTVVGNYMPFLWGPGFSFTFTPAVSHPYVTSSAPQPRPQAVAPIGVSAALPAALASNSQVASAIALPTTAAPKPPAMNGAEFGSNPPGQSLQRPIVLSFTFSDAPKWIAYAKALSNSNDRTLHTAFTIGKFTIQDAGPSQQVYDQEDIVFVPSGGKGPQGVTCLPDQTCKYMVSPTAGWAARSPAHYRWTATGVGQIPSVYTSTTGTFDILSITAPANLSPNGTHDTAGSAVTPTTLAWDAVSGATGYRFNYYDAPVPNNAVFGVGIDPHNPNLNPPTEGNGYARIDPASICTSSRCSLSPTIFPPGTSKIWFVAAEGPGGALSSYSLARIIELGGTAKK